MQRHLFVTIFYGVVTFIQSYSYNRPFKGKHNVDVARAENEFDTPGLYGRGGIRLFSPKLLFD